MNCQSARRLGDAECGNPALFKYSGIVRPALFMCSDCAYAIMHDLGWPIKDGRVRLEPLTGMKYRLYCKSCFAHTVVYWDPYINQPTVVGSFHFCPSCGERSTASYDPDKDYWETMSESFNGAPVQLLMMLYDEWPRNRYARFRDFYEHELAAYDSGESLEVDA